MKKILRTDFAILSLFAIFCLSCLVKLGYSLWNVKSAIESDGINEYLVNYSAGFVRRGLAGELLLYIYNTTWTRSYAVNII